MPVTQSQARAALEMGLYDAKTIKVGNLSEGLFGDAARTLPANKTGVVGYHQVGESSPTDNYLSAVPGWFLGKPNLPTSGDTGDKFAESQVNRARIQSRLREAAAELNDSGSFGIGIVRQETMADDNVLALQSQDPYDPNTVSGVSDIPRDTPFDLAPAGRQLGFAGEGDYIVWLANPGASSQTFDYDEADAVFNLPFLGWNGKGL